MNAKEWLYNKYIAESINIEELHTFSGEFLLRAIEEYYQYKLSEITEEKMSEAIDAWESRRGLIITQYDKDILIAIFLNLLKVER